MNTTEAAIQDEIDTAGMGAAPASEHSWNTAEAIDVCIAIEMFCPQYGCHVALTGGNLYKAGPRKDLDLIFYRIRQKPLIDQVGLFEAMSRLLGWKQRAGWGWCVKWETPDGRLVDTFWPEEKATNIPIPERAIALGSG